MAAKPQLTEKTHVDSPDQVMAEAVRALLGPPQASASDTDAAAGASLQLLHASRATMLGLLATSPS